MLFVRFWLIELLMLATAIEFWVLVGFDMVNGGRPCAARQDAIVCHCIVDMGYDSIVVSETVVPP